MERQKKVGREGGKEGGRDERRKERKGKEIGKEGKSSSCMRAEPSTWWHVYFISTESMSWSGGASGKKIKVEQQWETSGSGNWAGRE